MLLLHHQLYTTSQELTASTAATDARFRFNWLFKILYIKITKYYFSSYFIFLWMNECVKDGDGSDYRWASYESRKH